MATYGTDASPEPTNTHTYQRSLREPSPTVISDRYNLMTDLPPSYELRSSTTPKQLHNAVKAIHNQLEQNDWQGNQWLVIMGMSQAAIDRLSNKADCLPGVSFRFMWIGTTGLIKVVPSAAHDLTTSGVSHYITCECIRMGVAVNDIVWGLTVTTPGTVTTHGKQPDNCFFPPNRQPLGGQFNGWQSLVIETGVSESLKKLRQDAIWWFQNSSGDTRIVLLISIKARTKEVRFEKWQLAPPNLTPLTRQRTNQLRQQANLMAPLIQQQAASQSAFCHQEVIITPTSITGGPIVIPFRAIFDRQPTGAEGDIVINNQGFRAITRFI